jgi:capsular exopolysaccharide synthesis family protein
MFVRTMELKQVIKTLQRWWWLILAGTIAAGAISYLATRATPYSYLSNTTLLVGQTFRNANVTEGDIGTSQTLADVYASSALREPVLAGALKSLNLDWNWESLRERVSTRVPPNLPVIEISVVDTDPARAQQFASAVAAQIIAQGTAAENSSAQDRQFTRDQIADLRAKITGAQAQVRVLDDELSKASSARDLAERRSRIDALNVQVSTWQQTYATLERNLLEGSPNVITLYEQASYPTVPIGPKLTQNVVLASLVGLVISLVIAFALEVIDDSIKSVEDARRASGLSVLGSVAHIRGPGYPGKLVTLRNDNNRAAEAYRVLRTNLQFSVMGKPFQTLMVTSSRSREGKSITAANLAVALAQSGRKTALVDCDLRRPTQHEIFQMPAETGLTSLFLDEALTIDGSAPEKYRNLTVIPAGPMPHNPAELLDSVRMAQVMDQLKAQFEVVVLDVPPVLSVADATIIGARCDAVLLVVDCGYTRRAQIKRAKEALLAVGARVLGVAVNRVSEDSEDDYYFAHTTRTKGGGRRLLLRAQTASGGAAPPSPT